VAATARIEPDGASPRVRINIATQLAQDMRDVRKHPAWGRSDFVAALFMATAGEV
jgi:hypothetical protein